MQSMMRYIGPPKLLKKKLNQRQQNTKQVIKQVGNKSPGPGLQVISYFSFPKNKFLVIFYVCL